MSKVSESQKVLLAQWLLDSDSTRLLSSDLSVLEGQLEQLGLTKIYRDIELPLVAVLLAMHERGILVDVEILKGLERDNDVELRLLLRRIYEFAGREFNLNSPKQLGEVLFGELGIGGKKKTKTGQRSTSAVELLALKAAHPVVPLVLQYRELFKLQSTYVLPLSEIAVNSLDGRIHTTFVQIHTATGRLSSESPNLQNIPTGTPLAARLRSAFIAAPKHSLLSLDYSQIELRVLASVSGDPAMIAAFKNDQDIHRLTASQVYHVPLDAVTVEQRKLAKTLNFGVIYGMGAQAFARSSGLNYIESEEFIAEYFRHFAEVKRWHERVIGQAKQLGYVENMLGRKRWLPNITSPNERSAAEARRAAINMPIQSLAADILKIAMIRVSRELPDVPLLLSIHDELVFEVPDAMLKVVAPKISAIMESAYGLKVPLKVDVAMGKNWAEIT